MGEVLAITGSVAGLISLGIQVTQSLVEFYTSYKHRDSEIAGMTERLENLLSIFESLGIALSNRKFQVEEQNLMDNIESSIKKCDELVQELKEECQKCRKAMSGGIKAVFATSGNIPFPTKYFA